MSASIADIQALDDLLDSLDDLQRAAVDRAIQAQIDEAVEEEELHLGCTPDEIHEKVIADLEAANSHNVVLQDRVRTLESENDDLGKRIAELEAQLAAERAKRGAA